MTTSTTYRYGDTVTLPARFTTVAGVTETATVQFADEVDRFVRVNVGGYTQTISFEELAAAAEAASGNRDSLSAAAGPDDEFADIAIAVAQTLNEIVEVFGPDAIGWIRDELLRGVRTFADRNDDIWIEDVDGGLSMLDGWGAFQGWPFEAVERVHGPLAQQSGDPLPVAHVTSWWQRPLGWVGIATPTLCNERIVAGRVSGPVRECRECQRALDGER